MLLDNTDLSLLRLTGTMRNIPTDISTINRDIFSQEKFNALCKIGLLILNRNKLSYSLTDKAVILLSALGYNYGPLGDTTPSSQKLKRRLESGLVTALFHASGFDVYADNVFSLEKPSTYISAMSIRKDNSQTRVFGGARFTGIARNETDGFLVQYIDEGKMYFTNEMRLFNNTLVSTGCKRNIIYTGNRLEEIATSLMSASAFAKSKRNQNDAVSYRIAMERTQYPLYIIEASQRGSLQLKLISSKNYRAAIIDYAFKNSAKLCDNQSVDAVIDGELFIMCADLDMTRLKAAISYAKALGKTRISIIALPWQLPFLESWCEDIFSVSLYAIEQSEVEALIPELNFNSVSPAPVEMEDGYVQII